MNKRKFYYFLLVGLALFFVSSIGIWHNGHFKVSEAHSDCVYSPSCSCCFGNCGFDCDDAPTDTPTPTPPCIGENTSGNRPVCGFGPDPGYPKICSDAWAACVASGANPGDCANTLCLCLNAGIDAYCPLVDTPVTTEAPTSVPDTPVPTPAPTAAPTSAPTSPPTIVPTSDATIAPTTAPTAGSTAVPGSPTPGSGGGGNLTPTPGASCGNVPSRAVTSYKQSGQTWDSKRLDSSPDPNDHIGLRGCFLTCLSMLSGMSPPKLDDFLSAQIPPAINTSGGIVDELAAAALKYKGYYNDPIHSDAEIILQLSAGNDVIAEVLDPDTGTVHFVVVTGYFYDSNTKKCRITINDPKSTDPKNYLDEYPTVYGLRIFQK